MFAFARVVNFAALSVHTIPYSGGLEELPSPEGVSLNSVFKISAESGSVVYEARHAASRSTIQLAFFFSSDGGFLAFDCNSPIFARKTLLSLNQIFEKGNVLAAVMNFTPFCQEYLRTPKSVKDVPAVFDASTLNKIDLFESMRSASSQRINMAQTHEKIVYANHVIFVRMCHDHSFQRCWNSGLIVFRSSRHYGVHSNEKLFCCCIFFVSKAGTTGTWKMVTAVFSSTDRCVALTSICKPKFRLPEPLVGVACTI